MYIHGYEDSEISMDIHGYLPKNGLEMDMDMDAIFHLHGKPGIFVLTGVTCTHLHRVGELTLHSITNISPYLYSY